MTRRRFLTFLGAGSAALAGSAGEPKMGVPMGSTEGRDAAVIVVAITGFE